MKNFMSEIVGIEFFFLYISFLFFWERQLLHSLWATWVIVLMWFRKKCYWVCPMRMTLEWHPQWMDFWCCFVQIVFRNLRMNVTSLVFEEITHQYPFEGNVFNSPAFCFSSSCNNSITPHNNSGLSDQRYVYNLIQQSAYFIILIYGKSCKGAAFPSPAQL